MNRLIRPPVAETLRRLHGEAESNEAHIMPAVIEAAAERDASAEHQLSDLLADAFMAVDQVNGELLHFLARARRPGRIVEFGCSMGLSTIYLAAALEDREPPLISTELEPAKVTAARENLARAGLADRVEIRPGDATETLADLDDPVSLLFLDGWKGLYLPMLRILEDQLVAGAIIVADDTQHPALAHLCADYLSYVRDAGGWYTSVSLPIDDGVEISWRQPR